MELNELTRERLTDDRTYKEVKNVAEGHARAGRTVDIDQLRYIKLAEYEMEEKDMNDEIEQAYREGYNLGVKKGYDKGYATAAKTVKIPYDVNNIAAQLPDQSENLDEDELRLARYGGDEHLSILAEAVDDEFGKEDMEQISIILTRIDIPKDRNLSGYEAVLYGRQHYLREKYAALNAEEAKKRRKNEKPISDRAAYFKRMLEQEARKEG